MFNLFRKKSKNGNSDGLPALYDIDEKLIQEGDMVESLRYDMGLSKLVVEDGQYFYLSLNSGKKVSWLKMVDAITENQKVKKIEE